MVGVSGGPDSVCLLDILYKLINKYDLRVVVAHVNYGLRGKDSEKDEKLTKDLSKKYSLPIEVKYVTRYALCVSRSEEHLRQIRYDFFEKVRAKHRAGVIAVGHNLNDQAETVMMRILRGAGLRGLGAIKFKNKNIIRPLLNIPRKEILAHLRRNKLPCRIDRTNLALDFTRNKIRNKLLPHLEKEFNPNIQGVLYTLSQSVSDDYDFISRDARQWIKRNKKISLKKFLKLHPSLQKEILRQKIEEIIPALKEIESAHIDEILKIVKSTKNKRQKINLKSLKIERIGDRLIVEKN